MVTGQRMILSIVATVAVAAAAVAVSGAVIASRAEEQPPPPVPQFTLRWAEGACVSRTGARFDLVPCNGGDAEVLAVAPSPQECPAPTDVLMRVEGGRTACARNHVAPHPGDPGRGGGVLRAGDCLTRDGRERPCSAKGWYGRAVAVLPGGPVPGGPGAGGSRCPGGSVDSIELSAALVCLGRGGQVPGAGDCVTRPSRGRVAAVACRSRRAWGRVLGFAASAEGCPAAADHALTGPGRPATCLALARE
ncbi:hypothetical protein [Nonomuraea sp. NPDC050310]|uniref:hypothetical protein n=1 Tax=unclassified Nonomuraea TaxID=2593643 RepID=UPI0033EEE02A